MPATQAAKMLEHYSIEFLPAERPQALREEIMQLWLASGALHDRAKAEKREPQVVALARDRADSSIATLASIYPDRVPQLDMTLWHYRAFVVDKHRNHKLARQLCVKVRDTLNLAFSALDPEARMAAPKGILAVMENKYLHDNDNYAVTPLTRFMYIGDDARGYRQYVYYFDDVRLPVAPMHAPRTPPQ